MSRTRITDPKQGKRPLRVAAEILRDIPDIVRRHVELPDTALISFTDVEVSPDLGHARIYFSLLGEHEPEQGAAAETLLNERRKLVRYELAQRLIMRQHPDVKFVYDPTPARAARIEELLRQAREQSGSGSEPPI